MLYICSHEQKKTGARLKKKGIEMEKETPQVEPAQAEVVETQTDVQVEPEKVEPQTEVKENAQDIETLAKENEELKRLCRKWETRAKENKDAKPQLDEVMEQLKNLQSENEGFKSQLDEYVKEKERTELVNRVSVETGLPATVLNAMKADTEDELLEVAQLVKKTIPLYPTDVNDGSQHVDIKLSRAEIAKIKNPHEREKAILNNIVKE